MEDYESMVATFCRHVGVGFQILNDLKDWRGDVRNKVIVGQDAMALRPTLLLALAIKVANAEQRHVLQSVLDEEDNPLNRLEKLKRIFEQTDVFSKAEALVDKSRERAEAIADEVEPESLRRFLYFLVDTVMAPEEEMTPLQVQQNGLVDLSISASS